MRRYIVAVVSVLVLGAMFPTAAFAGKPTKAPLCHFDAVTGEFKLLNLPPRAIAAHLDHHAEDLAVGEGVDENCEPTGAPVVPADCYTNEASSYQYDGVIDTVNNVTSHRTPDCTGPDTTSRDQAWVQASDLAGAQAIMSGLGTYDLVECSNLADTGFPVPTDFWHCVGLVAG